MAGRKPRRKSKSAAVYLPIAVVLISALVICGTSVFLRIIRIEVIGASKYSASDIILLSGIKTGDNLMLVKSRSASNKIRSEMPYINDVSIKYSLPDTVRIVVSETTAIAAVSYHGELALIDTTGRILEMTDTAPAGLVEIRGFSPVDATVGNGMKAATGDDTRLQQLKDVLTAIDEAGMRNDVPYLDVSNIVYITIGYMDRFTVILGTTDNIRYKLDSLPESLADIETRPDGDGAWTIDLTVRGQQRWAPDR